MSTVNGRQSPKFTFCDDDGRGKVKEFKKKNKFRPGDSVYLCETGRARQGPYVIASVPSHRRYTLCFEDGQWVRDGEEVGESDLESV